MTFWKTVGAVITAYALFYAAVFLVLVVTGTLGMLLR